MTTVGANAGLANAVTGMKEVIIAYLREAKLGKAE
jgi:hypothetical protein